MRVDPHKHADQESRLGRPQALSFDSDDLAKPDVAQQGSANTYD